MKLAFIISISGLYFLLLIIFIYIKCCYQDINSRIDDAERSLHSDISEVVRWEFSIMGRMILESQRKKNKKEKSKGK